MVVIDNGVVKIPIKVVGEDTGRTRTSSTASDEAADNLAELGQMTKGQIGEIKSFAQDPGGFLIGRVFGRFATGAVAASVLAAMIGIVRQVLDILMSPGGPLDRRLKILMDRRIEIFQDNQERVDIALGLKTVRATAYPSPRGGFGVVNSNLRNLNEGRTMRIYQNTEAKGLFVRLN